jgi:hypothetical protein
MKTLAIVFALALSTIAVAFATDWMIRHEPAPLPYIPYKGLQ